MRPCSSSRTTTFVPFNGKLTLIDNDGTDPVTGTFAGLPGGTFFGSGGHAFRISYQGGTGNDVVLESLITEYHLSEGATGGFFDTDLVVANPTTFFAPFQVRFLKPDGTVVLENWELSPRSRMTIRVDELGGLENTEVSMVVKSTDFWPLIVERTMRWDTTGYGAHTEKAVGGPSTKWYFAEGSQGFFSTYLLLANPNNAANSATVEFLRENNTPIVRTYPLAPNSRFTVDANTDPDLANQSFGMTVQFDLPGVAERSMYFGTDPLWKAGHESAGVTAPSSTWFLAEGATGAFFETFILMANPNDAAADVTVTFLPDTGIPIVEAEDHSGAQPPDDQHRSGRSGARERRRRHALHVDTADRRRARAVLAGSGAQVVRSAQQLRRDRTGRLVGTRGGTRGWPRGLSDLHSARESKQRAGRRDAHVPARRQAAHLQDVHRAGNQPLQRDDGTGLDGAGVAG